MGGRVQLIHETDLSAEEYVSTQARRGAKLERCPRHPGGGCRLGSHGTCGRKYPDGMRIARHYCRDTPETFSMLPQFMAAGVAGTLDAIEEGAAAAESEAGLAAAEERMRPARRCHPRAARRWIQRRDTWVRALLTIVIGLFPDQFAGTPVRISAFRRRAGTGSALTALRLLCVSHLQSLPAPRSDSGAAAPSPDRKPARQHTIARVAASVMRRTGGRGPRQGGTRPCDPGQRPDPGFRPDAQGLDPHLRARRL